MTVPEFQGAFLRLVSARAAVDAAVRDEDAFLKGYPKPNRKTSPTCEATGRRR